MMYTYMYSIMSCIGQIGQSNTAGIRHVSRTKFKSNIKKCLWFIRHLRAAPLYHFLATSLGIRYNVCFCYV